MAAAFRNAVRNLRSRTKQALERLSGCTIERLGGRSLVMMDNRRPLDAWFLQRVQLKSTLQRLAVDLVLDVGANTGKFGRQLRTVYSGDLISFEPVASVFRKLEDASSGDPRWKARQFALGRTESHQTINVSGATNFSSLLKTNAFCSEQFGMRAVGSREETVHVRRLDDALADDVHDLQGRRLFLKMDTQGYDLEVFAGAGRALDQVVALQSEVSMVPIYDGMPHWTESIAEYERAGFSVAGMIPVSWDSRRVIEYDCLLTRE